MTTPVSAPLPVGPETGRASWGNRARWGHLVVLAVVIAVLTYPVWSLVPQAGLDPSWQFGLAWAKALGMQWGPDVAFTYGPLGYTLQPMLAWPEQVVSAMVIHVAGVGMLVFAVYALARTERELVPLYALVITAVASALILLVGERQPSLVLAAFPVGLLLLRGHHGWPLYVLGGCLVGVVGQQKLSDAALVGGFMFLAALGQRDRGSLAAFVGAAVASWLGIWIVAGQYLDHVSAFIANTLAIVAGYPAAMALEQVGYEWHYLAAFAAVGLLLWQVRVTIADWSRRQQLAAYAAIAWALWVAFREGFVRHDGHDHILFVIVFTLAITIAVATTRRPPVAAALAATVAVLTLGTYVLSFAGLLDRQASLQSLASSLSAVTSQTWREDSWSAAMERLATAYHITPALIDELGDASTAADPWDTSALAPTDVRWDPAPPLLLINAYSPGLDDLIERDLAQRPRQLLRRFPVPAVDNHNPAWEAPRYQRRVYCDYAVDATMGEWQVLRPNGVERCSEPFDNRTVRAVGGEPVDVPRRAGAITLATITYDTSLLDTIVSAAYKPPERFVTYGDRRWRLAMSPRSVELMLNSPTQQEAFPDLPVVPFTTLTLESPANVEFSFVDVEPSLRAGDPMPRVTPSAEALVISSAEALPETATAPTAVQALDVELTQEERCVELRPSGPDPQLWIDASPGDTLYVQRDEPGPVELFVAVDGGFDGQHGRVFQAAPGLQVIQVPSSSAPEPWLVRIDPPGNSETRVCLAVVLEVVSTEGLELGIVDGPIPATVAPATIQQNQVDVYADGGCLRMDPLGEDPWVIVGLDPGASLYLSSVVTGPAQVFVLVDDAFSEQESRRFRMDGDTWQILPAQGSDTPWVVRVDPPSGGSSLLCLAEG